MRLIHILAVSEQKTWEGWGGGEGGAHRREECPGSESQGRAWGPLGAKPNPALSARVGLPPAWAAPSQRGVRGGREAGARPGCGRSASPRSTSLLPPEGQARDPHPGDRPAGSCEGRCRPLLSWELGSAAGPGMGARAWRPPPRRPCPVPRGLHLPGPRAQRVLPQRSHQPRQRR